MDPLTRESAVVILIPQNLELEREDFDRRASIPGRTSSSTLQSQTTTATTNNKSAVMVIDKTMSSAANLVKLLPTGTVLAFQTLSPSFSHQGACHTANRCLMVILIAICLLSCIFFSFTDSVIGSDGRLYFGIATFRGFYIFNYDHGSKEEEDKSKVFIFEDLWRFRLRWLDYLHAMLSLSVFLTLCFTDANTQICFFPETSSNTKEVLVNLQLGAGFIAGVVFKLFPTCRKGIGYS